MKKYEPKNWNIQDLKGISSKNIEEHYKLYEGYVKNTNQILEKISVLQNDDNTVYAASEMQRRLGFEFDGMRNHEYYFSSLEGGSNELDTESNLYQQITSDFGSYDQWLQQFKTLAKTRGVGWAMLYYDPIQNQLINAWIDEQHLGHLTGLPIILALDMWEHSFVGDYWPSGKGQYIDDFFENLNWSVIEKNYEDAV